MEWRDIPGYNGVYQINEYGTVRSFRKLGRKKGRTNHPRELKSYFVDNGWRVTLERDDGKKEHKRVNVLMYQVGFLSKKLLSSRKVEKVDEHGTVVENYPSVSAAGKANYITHTAVRYYCDGKNKKPFDDKYTFRYASPRTRAGRKSK